jgi:hypothetical protein
MQFIKIFSIIIISMLLSSPVFAQIKSFAKPYKEFKDVQFFGYITVTVEGDAYKIGLFKSELTDYVKLLFKNNFAGIKYINSTGKPAKEVGLLRFKVWTVGDDYPVVYYVEGKMGSVDGETFFWDKFLEVDELNIHIFTQPSSKDYETSAVTGYGSKTDVPDAIRKSLKDMIEKFAIAFFKARGAI